MILLDGIEYTVKTPEENTDDLVSFINNYCESNNIVNEFGELVYVENNKANPLYMLVYAMGYMSTTIQKLVYNAGCSLSIPEASERQLLNIATIAGINRSQPTRTIINSTAYADDPDIYSQELIITPENIATIYIAGSEVVFRPAYDVHIQPGQASQVILIADQYGSYDISANTITGFDSIIPGLRKLDTKASTPGQSLESLASFRSRLQKRSVEGTQLERAATAIQSLEGVAMCNIFFNYSPSLPETIMIGEEEVIVGPRKALLLVQGYNEDIAKTFYRYLFCETTSSDEAITQNYITHANQTLPVYIVPPAVSPVYVQLYVNNVLSEAQKSGIKDTICSLMGTLTIGAEVTSVDIISIVEATYNNLIIQGCKLSLDDEAYDYKVTLPISSLPSFSGDHIVVEGL